MFEYAELGHWIVAIVLSTLIAVFAVWITDQIKKTGHYCLTCMYPGCDFKVMVSDEKYSYICDDLMADHQNRKHPLEESNL